MPKEVSVERSINDQFLLLIHLHSPSFRLTVSPLEPQQMSFDRAAGVNFSHFHY